MRILSMLLVFPLVYSPNSTEGSYDAEPVEKNLQIEETTKIDKREQQLSTEQTTQRDLLEIDESYYAVQLYAGTSEPEFDAELPAEQATGISAEKIKRYCSDKPDSKNSWRCRILDENSYVIAAPKSGAVLGEMPGQGAKQFGSGNGLDASGVSGGIEMAIESVTGGEFLDLQDSYYAVQIFANSNIEAGMAFINQKRLGRATLLHTEVRGRAWYVALLGVYSSRELAQKRANAYLSVHGGDVPWIRSIKSLKLVYKKTLI